MKYLKTVILIIALGFYSVNSYSQKSDDLNDENYCRANIAYSDFQLLGVSFTQHAKCVKAVNYLEPGKTGKRITINGIDFVDDGLNYDLVANDGILTSKQLTNYTSEVRPLPVGIYRDIKNQTVLYDNSFGHVNKINETTGGKGTGINKFKISCTFVWVKCSSWPSNLQQICNSFSWPFHGYFTITECELGWV